MNVQMHADFKAFFVCLVWFSLVWIDLVLFVVVGGGLFVCFWGCFVCL